MRRSRVRVPFSAVETNGRGPLKLRATVPLLTIIRGVMILEKFVGKRVWLLAGMLLFVICMSGCEKRPEDVSEGSFGYEITYNTGEVYFRGGETYDYFQCVDTIDAEVGQGVRVTRYECDYDFDVLVNAINMETERGLDVTEVMIGKKAYPAYMLRITVPGADGKMYAETDYQVSYKNINLIITAVFDVKHAAIVEKLIDSFDIK